MVEVGELLGEEDEQSLLQEILKFFVSLFLSFNYPLCFCPPFLPGNLPIDKNLRNITVVKYLHIFNETVELLPCARPLARVSEA